MRATKHIIVALAAFKMPSCYAGHKHLVVGPTGDITMCCDPGVPCVLSEDDGTPINGITGLYTTTATSLSSCNLLTSTADKLSKSAAESG
jgi:hypothetical protein